MEPIIFYWKEFWTFALGEGLNFVEMWEQGDAVGLLSLFFTVSMLWLFFLRPVVRLVTGRKRRRRIL